MLRKIALTALACNILVLSFAQRTTNVAVLEKTAIEQKAEYIRNMQKAYRIAKEKGWATKFKTKAGGEALLVGIDHLGFPVYLITDNNVIAAATIGTNKLWTGGSSGLNINGSSMNVKDKIAIWDGGKVLLTHQELTGRVTIVDASGSVSDHATHVAGTMIASGVNSNAKGMAHGSLGLLSFDYDNDASEMSGQASNLLVSNHSYGMLAGWNYNGRWEFYGAPNDNEDYKFGYYSSSAQMYDSISYNAPFYLIVKSAGNNRSENGPAVGANYWRMNSSGAWVEAPRPGGIYSNDGYDIISTSGTAKNILTVGAVNGIAAGYNNVSDVVMSSFSSWGPTDDGRIKPDVVADGVNVTSSTSGSATSYGTMSGTSMSAPSVTGSLLLLQEYYSQIHSGAFMRSSTLKGLVIHTADEAGAANGPDYKHGWGLVNVSKASDVIKSNNLGSHQIFENVLNNGQTFTMNVSASGPITATICWTDPKGSVLTSNVLDNPSKRLIHDLDIRVIQQGGTTYMPWVMDPANPDAAATTGDNDRDNVEKINIYNVTPGLSYTIQITHKNTLARGSQAYSLILSGVNGQVFCTSAPTSNAGARIDSVSFGSINKLNTNNCSSYTDYSSISTNVQPSQTLPIFVRVNSCDATNNNKIVKVFIDLNNNGNFNDAGETVATSPVIAGNGDFTGNITIPSTVIIGNPSIMRIIVQETSNPADINPCGTYNNGETQDYKLIFAVPANDIKMETLLSPANNSCNNSSQYVTVKIKNNGTVNRTNIPLSLVVKNGSTVVATVNGTYSGTILPGETKNYTYQVPFSAASGTNYTISTFVSDPLEQSTSNDTLNSSITIATAGAAPQGLGRVCGNSAILLVENPQTSGYFWYDDLNGDPLGVGFGFNASTVPANNTFYVGTGARVSAGLKTKSTFPNGGGYLSNTDHYIKYSSSSTTILESARLYTKYPGKIEFIVADITSETGTTYTYTPISSTIIDVYATSPNPAPGNQPGYDAADTGAVFYLNIALPSGNHAIIIKTQGGTNIFRNNNVTGSPYPFVKPGVIQLTGNNAVAEGGNFQEYYYFLYDMKIRTSDCMSNRATIVATVAPTPVISQNGNQLVSSIGQGNQWYLNGNIISGANGQNFTPTTGGSYTVQVTDNFGCQKTSNPYSWFPTSTGTIPDNVFDLKVSPNPNPGSFVVRFKAVNKENVVLELVSAHGQTVYSRQYPNVIGNFAEQVNLRNLASGIYVLKVQYGSEVFYKKLVIDK